jgi:hypothetical protein
MRSAKPCLDDGSTDHQALHEFTIEAERTAHTSRACLGLR